MKTICVIIVVKFISFLIVKSIFQRTILCCKIHFDTRNIYFAAQVNNYV